VKALQARVDELQRELENQALRFEIDLDQRVFMIFQYDAMINIFYIGLDWHCSPDDRVLYLDHVELGWIAFHQIMDDNIVQLSIDGDGIDSHMQMCDRKTLASVLTALGKLDVPELPEDSRAALHRFLNAARLLI
jgi:hypothetical protein